MTGKRFELIWRDTGEVLFDNKTGLEKGIYSPNYRFHVRDMMNELSEENEQLKQFKDNVFDLIDKNIKETKELFEDGKIDLISYNDAMIILTGLKEELKGDVE